MLLLVVIVIIAWGAPFMMLHYFHIGQFWLHLVISKLLIYGLVYLFIKASRPLIFIDALFTITIHLVVTVSEALLRDYDGASLYFLTVLGDKSILLIFLLVVSHFSFFKSRKQ